MTAAVLAATRRLGTLRPWPLERARFVLGAVAAAIGGAQLVASLAQWVAADAAVAAALQATALTAAATGLGAAPVLAARRLAPVARITALGFGAGVMLAAAILALLVPAYETALTRAGSGIVAAVSVTAALAAGAAALYLLDRALPHRHLDAPHAPRAAAGERGAALVAIAIALHNLPEGLAVGAAAASGAGGALTLGIALQNVPEGLVVAVALVALGATRLAAVGIAFATGLLEPVGGLLGATLATASAAALPWALAGAAGAMLFVVLHEMVPQLRQAGMRPALGALAGIAAMIVLDAAVA
jgi:ZIP family zinc transporter